MRAGVPGLLACLCGTLTLLFGFLADTRPLKRGTNCGRPSVMGAGAPGWCRPPSRSSSG